MPEGLERIRLHRVRLALREPFVAAHGIERDREVVVVEAVGAGGESGWGECVALSKPTYTAEFTDGAWRRLRGDLGPGLLQGRVGLADDARDAPMAWSALIGAVTDLQLRRTRRSLATSIGGARVTVATTAVIGRQPDVRATVAAAEHRVAEGHRGLKLKVAPEWDRVPLAAVRAALPDIALAADANGSYREGSAALDGLVQAATEFGLDYIEQPLAAADLDGLARVARATSVPIALDESLATRADLDAARATGVAFIVNLKPGRVGGLDAALVIVAAAAEAGWPIFVGGMLETGIGRAYALAAASWEACNMPTDLGPSSRYFVEDLTDPIELLEDGSLPVPFGAGLGVEPRADRLDAATVDRAELRA